MTLHNTYLVKRISERDVTNDKNNSAAKNTLTTYTERYITYNTQIHNARLLICQTKRKHVWQA